MSLLLTLRQQRGFTATEAAIADYLLNNAGAVSGLTIAELAEATYSSKAAIVRLCGKLGLKGYRELRLGLAVEEEKNRFERSGVDVNHPFIPRESTPSIMRSVHAISQQALDDSYAAIDPNAVERAARALRKARTIYIYAVGDSYITGCAFANMVMKLGIHCIMAEQYNERMSLTYGAAAEDAALFLTYSGGMMAHLHTELGILRRSGCTSVLISSLDECPGIDHFITLPAQENAVGKVAGYYSQAALRYALNCLYGVIYAQDLEKNQARKDKAESAAQ